MESVKKQLSSWERLLLVVKFWILPSTSFRNEASRARKPSNVSQVLLCMRRGKVVQWCLFAPWQTPYHELCSYHEWRHNCCLRFANTSFVGDWGIEEEEEPSLVVLQQWIASVFDLHRVLLWCKQDLAWPNAGLWHPTPPQQTLQGIFAVNTFAFDLYSRPFCGWISQRSSLSTVHRFLWKTCKCVNVGSATACPSSILDEVGGSQMLAVVPFHPTIFSRYKLAAQPLAAGGQEMAQGHLCCFLLSLCSGEDTWPS